MAQAEKKEHEVRIRTNRSGISVGPVSDYPVTEMSNSLMSDLLGDSTADNFFPSAFIQREMSDTIRQIPAAEAEADRLSSGVRGSSPGDIRRKMGHRLGADFTGVRFHTGPENEARSMQMGARAWTRGSDVYFGRGGFDPQIAAHELVHTIQQGAVSGSVRNSAPAGTVQMWPWNKRKTEERKRHIDSLADRYRAEVEREKIPSVKSADEPAGEFVLEGLDDSLSNSGPAIEDNIIRKSVSEKDNSNGRSGMSEKDDNISQIGMSQKDNLIDIMSEKNDVSGKEGSLIAPKEDDIKDLMAVSGNRGPAKKEDILGLSTIELDGMDKVNKIEQKEILQNFVPIDGRSESDQSSNPANEAAVSDLKDLGGNIGITRNIQIGTNSAAQLTMLAENHKLLEDKNVYTSAINPAVSGAADVLGVGAGLVGVGTGAFDTYKNLKRLRAGGEKSDAVTSALDTVASGTGLVSSGINLMSKVGSASGAGSFLSPVTDFTSSNAGVIPGLNVATGAATALSGGIQSYKGWRSIGKINEQIKALEEKNKRGGLDKNQEELLKTFKQGKRISEFNRTSGGLKALSGGVTAGIGIAALATGPLAPLTAALAGLAGMATGVGRFIYDKVKKKKMRSEITAEDMGINWAAEMKRVRQTFQGEKLSDKEVRAIILKGHGFSEGTRTAAFKEITKRRAEHLMKTAQGVGEDAGLAQKVISALGIHRKHGQYAKGALKLLAKKLG